MAHGERDETGSEVTVTQRGARRVRGAHPWIYTGDVAKAQAGTHDVVRVVDPRGRMLGTAFYNSRSQVALRMIGRAPVEVDADFWRSRIRAAMDYRTELDIDADVYRLVHSEADRLPGLVVDRYADVLAVQMLSGVVDQQRDDVIAALVDLAAPVAVVLRNDSRNRRLEGLPQKVEVVHGELPAPLLVRDGKVRMEVDLLGGQKTGLFLDQRENRAAARRYARGRLLDCFSYHGAFALQLAGECDETIALDISKEAVSAIRRNAELNGVRIDARAENVFDQLRLFQDKGESFDTIVLDPPAFAKNRKAVTSALKGYKDINLRALKLLKPGGHLITASCSYHIDSDAFLKVVTDAAADVRAEVALVERRVQSRDHPMRLGMPESASLKCLVLRKLA